METTTVLKLLAAAALLAVGIPAFAADAALQLSRGLATAAPQTTAQKSMLEIILRWHDKVAATCRLKA